MATIFKRHASAKFWTIRYRDPAGKDRWLKGYTDKTETQKLANRYENEKVAIQRGDVDPQTEQKKIERIKSIDLHVTDYRLHLEAKGNSSNHVSYTIADVRKLIAHAQVMYATSITRAMVDAWVLSLTRAGRDTGRTINRRVKSVQAFLRKLRETGGVSEYVLFGYPMQKTQPTQKRRRRALTKPECAKLLKKASRERRDLYRFALLTGLRLGEIAAMTPRSFNLEARTLTVRSKDPRHNDRSHTLPLHRALIPILRKLCARSHDEPVFEAPTRFDAASLLRGDCELAGVDTTHVDFHALRHTFITRLAEAMVHPKILQELARHSNLDTTLRYYTHFRQADERKAIEALAA